MKTYSMGILFCGGLIILAAMMMSQTTRPAAPARATPARTARTGSTAQGGFAASMARGKQVYLQQCLACHQADALGVENMNPSLVKSKYVLGDKTVLVRIVLTGMKGVEIDGDAYHNVMAPHSDLTDQQIADVLTYVRNSFGNKAKAVTAAEVKAIRAKTKLN
ncbi:MAG: cytochrome c [Bacteroidota bacterium]|nr:cytochrome c [Bacteroidota bacterium]MDP4217335.1 cytochrome c [Bacteroidota bacterium]MDP4245780.1 cytochrome c [Bacteroidota bacterium]MDP4253561.1 cytochrome c [Bacteroidota bacterium]MDP4257074.1 cytochrome c [Bacteroidota bacterium]